MKFEEDNSSYGLGKKLGYLAAYAVFTSLLYLALTLTKRKIPFYYVMLITFGIAVIGLIVKRILK